jgi:hypothetical protein
VERDIFRSTDDFRGLQTTTEATEGYRRVAPGVLKSSARGEVHFSPGPSKTYRPIMAVQTEIH